MPNLKNSNATFWVIFKHCEVVSFFIVIGNETFFGLFNQPLWIFLSFKNVYFFLIAKIEKIKDYKASQHDDNLQATQSSEDLFHPDVIIKEGKECLKPDEPDDDSKESTVIHAEVIFETVPAIVDPDSTEGIILHFLSIYPAISAKRDSPQWHIV